MRHANTCPLHIVVSQLEGLVRDIDAQDTQASIVARRAQLVFEQERDAAGAGAQVEEAQFWGKLLRIAY